MIYCMSSWALEEGWRHRAKCLLNVSCCYFLPKPHCTDEEIRMRQRGQAPWQGFGPGYCQPGTAASTQSLGRTGEDSV